ncbi:MAG: hypothetical protein ACR5K2_03205 [Wolbachia sp.]
MKVKITFDQSSGDLDNIDKGYIDYQKIFIKEKQTESSKVQASVSKTETEVNALHMGTVLLMLLHELLKRKLRQTTMMKSVSAQP